MKLVRKILEWTFTKGGIILIIDCISKIKNGVGAMDVTQSKNVSSVEKGLLKAYKASSLKEIKTKLK